MRRSLPSLAFCGSVLLLGVPASAENPYEDNFTPIQMSQGQTERAAGVVVPGGVISAPAPAGTGGGGGGAGGPADQKAITPPAAPAKKDDKKKDDKQQPQMPPLPGLPTGKKPDPAQAGGGSQDVKPGEGCASCQRGLKKNIAQAKADLALANPQDPRTRSLLADANRSIAEAEAADQNLDKANAALEKARKSLDKALTTIGEQNQRNKENIEKLADAQGKRDEVIGGAATMVQANAASVSANAMKADGAGRPDCQASPLNSQYGTPSGAALQRAFNDLTGADTDENTAGGLVRAVAGVAEHIISIGSLLGRSDVSANAHLGAAPAPAPTQNLLSNVGSATTRSRNASDTALDKAKTAHAETKDAHKQSEQVEQQLETTTAQARAADTLTNTSCASLKNLGLQWDAADPVTKLAIALQAPPYKEQAQSASDRVKAAIDKLKTDQQKAEEQKDKAKKAVDSLAKALTR